MCRATGACCVVFHNSAERGTSTITYRICSLLPVWLFPKDPQGHLDEEAWECTASPKRYVNGGLWRFLSSCPGCLEGNGAKERAGEGGFYCVLGKV